MLCRRVTEGECEHRADRVSKPPDRGDRRAAEPAVFVDAGGNQRMRELEQDGPRPSENDESLSVQAAGDSVHGKPLRPIRVPRIVRLVAA